MNAPLLIPAGDAWAAVQAAAASRDIDVSLAGRVETWPASSIQELLTTDATRIYWDTDPPPSLEGFELACETAGGAKYRIEVTAPAPGGQP